MMWMGYDGMGRPVPMTDPSELMARIRRRTGCRGQYDYAGRQTNILWLTGLDPGNWPYSWSNSASECRTYNVNGQLASIGWGGGAAPVPQIRYNYSATQNNGQITQEVDTY